MPSKPVKKAGPKRKLTEREEDAALLIYDLDIISVDRLARVFDVTKPTVYSGIARARQRKGPGSRQRRATDSGSYDPTESSTGGGL